MFEILAYIFGAITTALFGALGLIHFDKRYKNDRRLKNILWVCLIASLSIGLPFQVKVLSHQHTYKTDLVLRYDEKFGEKIVHDRVEASKAISEYLQKHDWNAVTNEDEIDGLENVLSLFEDLGFYWKNGEISGTVLHQHFYYPMRMYCQETLGYIHREQTNDSKADWEYVEPLFNELTQIEAQKIAKDATNCNWSAKTLQDNLNAEIRLEHTNKTATPPINIQSQTVFNFASNAVSTASSNLLFNASALGTNLPSAFNAPNAVIGTVNVINPPSDTHIQDELKQFREDISKTNEVTTHQLLAVAKLVSELDKRTEQIQRLPDGRTILGGYMAVGSPTYAMTESLNGFTSYTNGEYASALAHFKNALDSVEQAPEELQSAIGSTIRPEWKAYISTLCVSCALVLQSNNLVIDYAYKAVRANPTTQTENVLVASLCFIAQAFNARNDITNSFVMYSEAATNYEFYGRSITNLSKEQVITMYSFLLESAEKLGKTNEITKARQKLDELYKVSP